MKQLFLQLSQAVSRYEEGCLLYDVYTQTRSKDVPNVVLHERYGLHAIDVRKVSENIKRYVNQTALNAHLQSDHFSVVAEALAKEDLLRAPLDLDDVFVERIGGKDKEVSP